MKAKIVCVINNYGYSEYMCKRCGKHLSGMRLASYDKCPRCDKTFSNKVTIVRSK